MSRVSTFANYQSALLNLMTAQTRSQQAQERISTEKIATDLTGYGRGSETLAALKSSQARIDGYLKTGEVVSARLTAQDLALNQVADSAGGARQAISDALAAGSLDGLMLEMQGKFQMARNGLNSQHQGRYLFSGGQVQMQPTTVATLAELAAAPAADGVFVNDGLKHSTRLDEGAAIETGFLASELGADLYAVFRDIQAFHEATPLTGQVSDATRDFLTAQLGRLDTARTAITDQAARNGSLQNRVDSIVESQAARQSALDGLISDRTDVDMAQALTDLQMSQVAIQASAQVISQLRDVSLLNFLR